MGELHNTYIDSACNYVVHALNALGTQMDRRHTTLTRTLIVIAAIITLSGAASADDYYVATWGNNNAQGNIAHPWQNVSYAAQQATAGDAVHLFDGTWYSETMNIDNSGNATHPITFTAYNGTPTLDGVDQSIVYGIDIRYGPAYINISGITIKSYGKGIYVRESNNVHISNCEIYDTSGTAVHFLDVTDSSLSDCDIHDMGWNGVMVQTNFHPTHHISITNNKIHDNPGTSGGRGHNLIDVFNFGSTYSLSDIDIIGNVLYTTGHYAIFPHGGTVMTMYRFNISNNIIYDTTAMRVSYLRDSIVHNNTIYDQRSYGIQSYTPIDSTTFTENTIYNTAYADIDLEVVPTGKVTFERNNITYYRIYDATGNIIDDIRQSYDVHPRSDGAVNVEYSDGTVFKREVVSGSGSSGNVKWYPSKSTLTVVGDSELRVTITAHNVTLRPTYGHLYDVTVDTWDEASGTYRITASSTESKNPTWVNLATKAASATYDITRDGKSCTPATTGADGVLRYHYTGTWDGPQTFEFSYASGGVDPAPDPAPCVENLRNDTPTQNSVTLRWDCSAPDMDYYTIYQTGAIPVDTVNKYYSAPKLEPDTPYTFGVSATNTAGITGDIVSITVRTASDGADPVPCVENLRNDTPTQNSVTLRWDCSAPDMDYYTIYQTGAIPVDTVNKYYSAPNLASDTPYTFGVSATNTAGITGDIVSITVRTAAEDNSLTARAGSDQTVNVNTLVTLDGSTSTADCGIKSYTWDFDSRNGIQIDATGAIVSHTCTEPRAYITTLTVTDTSGQTDSDTVLITVIEETTQTTDVSKITESIVPDGSLSEWAGADTVIFAGSDNTATVSLTWDGDNLYLGFDVTDTNLQASGTDEADSLHLDDSIEIYLDTNHNGGAAMQVDDYHFLINLNGALVDDQGTGSGKNYSWTGHANYAIDLDGTLNDDSDTDNGYVVEVAIPWSDLGGSPVTGDVMGLDLGVNDRDDPADGRKPFDWCNIDSSWAVPDGWGDMTFVENFDSNTVHIAKDVTASHGHSVTVPIMIHNATEIACYGVNLTYDVGVVAVTSITQGDFTTYFGYDGESAADGWVTVNTYVSETSLTGDVKIADVTLKAVGDAGDTSPLDLEIIAMTDRNGYPVSGTVSNGLFAVVSDTSPPVVTHPSASQLIPDDTDGVPSWGETATLNVTVTDESDIAGVTIDLSAIGGSPVQPMTHIGNNVWSVTTSASVGTPPRTYNLLVCATDIHGYTNMQESVELVVMRNGDVTGDNDVTPDDIALLENYVTYPGRYTISSEFVADVTGDGVVNIADAMMLANYVASPDQPLRYVGS